MANIVGTIVCKDEEDGQVYLALDLDGKDNDFGEVDVEEGSACYTTLATLLHEISWRLDASPDDMDAIEGLECMQELQLFVPKEEIPLIRRGEQYREVRDLTRKIKEHGIVVRLLEREED